MVISTTHSRASSEQAQLFSYGEAANPIRSGLTSLVPYRSFSPTFFDDTGSAVLALDPVQSSTATDQPPVPHFARTLFACTTPNCVQPL